MFDNAPSSGVITLLVKYTFEKLKPLTVISTPLFNIIDLGVDIAPINAFNEVTYVASLPEGVRNRSRLASSVDPHIPVPNAMRLSIIGSRSVLVAMAGILSSVALKPVFKISIRVFASGTSVDISLKSGSRNAFSVTI